MADRRDFFFRQQVTQAELDTAFEKLELADRDVVQDILGFGYLVNATYPATVLPSASVKKVLTNAFLGYDQLGQRLSNLRHGFQGNTNIGAASPAQDVDLAIDEGNAPISVVTPGNEIIISIFIEFERFLDDPRTDGNAATVNHIVEESIKFNIVQSAEAGLGLAVPAPLRTDQLLLADVTLVFGQTLFTAPDIDQTRREGFALILPHGSSHVEGGLDPIPNATPVSLTGGGLQSGDDKIKLDAVDFTGSGVGALFNKLFALFQPANIVAPAATTMAVTAELSGKSAGGSSSVEGVLTQTAAPNNKVTIQTIGEDDFLDGESKVYGRITVDNETTPTIWTLSFFSQDNAGVESPFNMTPFGGQAIIWYVKEAFSLENLPSDGFTTVPSDQVASTVPDATTTQKGIVELATDGEEGANLAVQADDSRLFPLAFYNAHLTARAGGIGVFGASVERFPDGGSARITQDGFGTFTFLDAGTYDISVNISTFQTAGGIDDAELRVPHDPSPAVPSGNGRVRSTVGGQNGDGYCASLRWVVTVAASETMNVGVPDSNVDARLDASSSISISRIR